MPRSKANESTTIKKRKKHERGKASEYRNLDPFATMDPEREQTKYTKELLTDHGLAKHARNFIKEKWWRDFCTSANEPRFYGCLFENYMFDEDGMLEWGYPGYEKVVQCLVRILSSVSLSPRSITNLHSCYFCKRFFSAHFLLQAMGYMHIIRAFGEENLNGWKVQWGMNIEYGPFIQLFNDEMQEQFGLTQPKSGFYDHSSKLSTLRTQRDVGKDL